MHAKAAAGFIVLSVSLFTNLAALLVVVGAILGAAAFVLWVRNSHNLRALDQFLKDQARAGRDALSSGDGG